MLGQELVGDHYEGLDALECGSYVSSLNREARSRRVVNVRLTNVMATVLALEAGGFLIVTLPIDRMIARVMRMICTTWTNVFRRSSNRLSMFIIDLCCWLSIVDQNDDPESLKM